MRTILTTLIAAIALTATPALAQTTDPQTPTPTTQEPAPPADPQPAEPQPAEPQPAAPADSPPQCPYADYVPREDNAEQLRTAMLCLANIARGRVSHPLVTRDQRLDLAAQRHANDMAERKYYDHLAPAPSPYGAEPAQRARAAGYPHYAAENIHQQFTPRRVALDWLNSRGHCVFLLTASVTDIGIGVEHSTVKWVLLGGYGSKTANSSDIATLCKAGAGHLLDGVSDPAPPQPPRSYPEPITPKIPSAPTWTTPVRPAPAARPTPRFTFAPRIRPARLRPGVRLRLRWSAEHARSVQYRWHRSTGDGWTPIPGATKATYRLTRFDAGRRIQAAVTLIGSGKHTRMTPPLPVRR